MSQLPDPAFAQPSTGWTEEMEAAARRTRPAPPPTPRWRVALRVSAWGAVIALLVAIVVGLLFVHRGDAEGSARVANSELELMLERGEGIDWRAPVIARHWWNYFRVTHGVVAATNRRLLYVGVPPEEILPREPEPQLLEESSFPYDRPIDLWRGRVFLGSLSGVVIRAPDEMRTFGVTPAERSRLDSVLTLMTRRQQAIRDSLEADRQKALEVADAARQPIFYVVSRGDALELIARQFNVTIEELQDWNALSSPSIRVGQRLLVKPRT